MLLCLRRKYMTIVFRGLELYIGCWHSSTSHLASCSRKHSLDLTISDTGPGKYVPLLYELMETSSELQYVLLQFLPAHNKMSRSPKERYCMNICNIPLPHNHL